MSADSLYEPPSADLGDRDPDRPLQVKVAAGLLLVQLSIGVAWMLWVPLDFREVGTPDWLPAIHLSSFAISLFLILCVWRGFRFVRGYLAFSLFVTLLVGLLTPELAPRTTTQAILESSRDLVTFVALGLLFSRSSREWFADMRAKRASRGTASR